MKLTRNELEQLIHEAIVEQSSVLLESPGHDSEAHEGPMVKQRLFHVAQQAQQLHDMVVDNQDLEPWVQDKIATAAASLRSVFEHLIYDRTKDQMTER